MIAGSRGLVAVLFMSCSLGTAASGGITPETEADSREAASSAPAARVIDFETETVGENPSWWLGNLSADSEAVITDEGAHGGSRALVVRAPEGHPRPAEVRKRIEDPGFRGKRIRVSAALRTGTLEWRARASFGPDAIRNDKPTPGPRVQLTQQEEWQTFSTILDVAEDSNAIDVVFALTGGGGSAWIDDVEVRVLGPAGAGDDPPAPLAGRALDNVVAFARLYGYVRYFYPGDEVAGAPPAAWEEFVAHGVREVESAPDRADLAQRLRGLFGPFAPALQVWLEGERVPAATTLPATADWTAWEHTGVGSPDAMGRLYSSIRRGDPQAGDRFVTLVTAIDGQQVRGRSIRVRARARSDGRRGTDAGLWIREVRPGGAGFYVEPEMQADVGAAWTPLEAAGAIDSTATLVQIGVQYIGTGAAWFEPLSLEVVENGNPRSVPLPPWNPGTAGIPAGWRPLSRASFFDISLRDGCEGSPVCLEIRGREPNPEPPFEAALPGGVRIRIPLALERAEGKTRPAAGPFPHLERPLVVSDRATRLAAVVIAWNILQHFYPYFDVVDTDWQTRLRDGLARGAQDHDLVSFEKTLKLLVAALRDGHGSVYHPQIEISGALPVEWAVVEGQVVLTEVAEACRCDLRRGDVVLRMDGVPMAAAIAAAESTVSAATPQFRLWKALYRLSTGPAGSAVQLGVRSSGGEAREVEVTRMSLQDLGGPPRQPRPATGTEVAPGVRYVDLDRCKEEDWKRILPDLAGARAVIYDMRGYPAMNLTLSLQHIVTRPIDSARWNVPIPRRPDRVDMRFQESNWTVAPAEPRIPGAAVFLTDGRAVSAAETYMGIVEHYALGPIVGAPTAGTNGNVNAFTLPGGYRVAWTGMKVLKHDGSRHHGVGILPTVPAERTLAGVAAGRDEVLERGIEVALELAGRHETEKRRGSAPESQGP